MPSDSTRLMTSSASSVSVTDRSDLSDAAESESELEHRDGKCNVGHGGSTGVSAGVSAGVAVVSAGVAVSGVCRR